MSNTSHNELGIEVFYYYHTAPSTVPFNQTPGCRFHPTVDLLQLLPKKSG